MSNFAYKSLDGWLVPGVAYLRKLQEHALELEDENEELKEQLAVSGSRVLQDRAEVWAVKWQELNVELGEVVREKIELEASKNAEIERLQREVDYLNEQLEICEGRRSTKTKSQMRDSRTGRFMSPVPDGNKKATAYQMHLKGYSNAQIAQKLNVSAETIKRYIRDMSHLQTPQIEENECTAACYY